MTQIRKVDAPRIQAQIAWGKAKKIFGPSAPHAPEVVLGSSEQIETKFLRHHYLYFEEPTSKGNYWLEAMDPLHRSWGHCPNHMFREWLEDKSSKDGFWDWIKKKPAYTDAYPGVLYLSPDESRKYLVTAEFQRLRWPGGNPERPK